MTIRLGIALKDDDYYMIYIPNIDNMKNNVPRKLNIKNKTSIIKVYLIDGPLLIIQYKEGYIEVLNLMNSNINDIGRITMKGYELIQAQSYMNIDISDSVNTSICILHFINSNDDIKHDWLCFDINTFINIKNNNNHDTSNSSTNIYMNINDIRMLLFHPPNVNHNIINTVTGIHYCSDYEGKTINKTIVTTTSGYLYLYNKSDGNFECKERELGNEIINANTKYTTLKTASSAIPSTDGIIIKSDNIDKLMILSSSSLLLLLEVKRAGFFVIGNFTNVLCTQILIGLNDDTFNDYPITLNKNILGIKSQWIICDMPGLNGSRYMIISDINKSWSKRCRSITCGDISIDKKRKKNNPNKDNTKKQKADDNNNDYKDNAKKQLSDVDTKSQESVIDALTIHLNKIMTTSDNMNGSINQKKLLLQVLRKNLIGFQNANDTIKFDFSLVDNNLSFLYQTHNDKSNIFTNKAVIKKNQNDALVLIDAAYIVDNSSNILLFVRIMNKSSMPVFRVKTNATLISSGKGYMKEINSAHTKSGSVQIIYPNHEAIVSCLIRISNLHNDLDELKYNKNQSSSNNSNTTITINLSWSELKAPSSVHRNLKTLSNILISDPTRLDIEMSHGWLGSTIRRGLGAAMIITNRHEQNQLIMTPFLIAKHCADTHHISKIINHWYDDAIIKCNRRLSLVSFMCHLPLILIGNNFNSSNDTINMNEKLNYYIRIHFYDAKTETSSKSNLYTMRADNHNGNVEINTICISGYNRDDLYDNLFSIRMKVCPESFLLLFASNTENLELLRLISLYLLDEMVTLALAWRMMTILTTKRKRNLISNDNLSIRISPRLTIPSKVAKAIYSKQCKTDRVLSYAFSKLIPFLY